MRIFQWCSRLPACRQAGNRQSTFSLSEMYSATEHKIYLNFCALVEPAVEFFVPSVGITCITRPLPALPRRQASGRQAQSAFFLHALKFLLCSRLESNQHYELRKLAFYPLNYESFGVGAN